ncbi:MAG TPA: alpha-L-arabinofuranosidase C-terminal domain-containing protein [bacterium]|nr:alpha-L-arabinofuranosidase C-terminal domain-containing protein [bacterium]HPN42025.1 alpha-L-arabinofuranosidase C-terminal domain-containing protein [bacterium]
MKRYLVVVLLALPLVLFAQQAKIKIDVDRTIGEIDPKIYGVFMEPIGFSGRRMGAADSVTFNTLYGTLYDPSSPLADENGFRKDYIDAMRELKITNMRWPGGNFVMAYNWQDGIGPKEQRPVRINLAWSGVDNNHVGTDEWIALNKSIGSENIICVNLGLATIQDAVYWVEYCNYKKGTYYSDLRAQNGHPKPYGIKIWDLGNEVDGAPWELGHKNADDYVKIAREAAKAMKSVDNTIKLVASGSSYYEATGQWVEWNRKVLTGLGDKIDYLSIHRYWENSPDYYTYMGQSAMDFEEKIIIPAAAIKTAKTMMGFTNPIYISFDEWGVRGRDLLSVLPVIQCLNSFVRHADVVKMANFTMMTSLLATEPGKGSFKSPLFYSFQLFSNNCLGNSIDTYVECDTFNTEKCQGIPFLDVTSTYSKETNTVYINVLNRHKDNAITADIVNTSGTLSGKAIATLINSVSLNEPFVFDKQKEYIPVSKEIAIKGNKMSCSFPAHSFTQIKVTVEK